MSISHEAKDKLMQYAFPGNVRELKAAIELAAVMSDEKEIKANDLNFHSISTDNMMLNEAKTLKQYTIDIITHYLKKNDGNVLKVADKLDIGKSTIYKMIQDKEILI